VHDGKDRGEAARQNTLVSSLTRRLTGFQSPMSFISAVCFV
jgi:hypothetical protein